MIRGVMVAGGVGVSGGVVVSDGMAMTRGVVVTDGVRADRGNHLSQLEETVVTSTPANPKTATMI